MTSKHMKFLRSQLAKAERKGDGNEQCQLLSQLGSELSIGGQYAEAAQCHTEQLAMCDAFSLPKIEKALAHRQLGECLVMLANYDEASEHHTQYLKLAQKHGTKKDEQEALTTIGRTAFLRADTLFEENEAAAGTDWLLFAQQKFLESLDVCDQLVTDVSEQQLLDMRCRLYLNLANVFSRQSDQHLEVKSHLKKALLLAQSLASREMELLVWINLSDHHQKCFDFEDALAAGERAAALAEKLDDKGRLVVALETMAQALISRGEFASGKKFLKRAFHNQKESEEEKVTLWKKLSQVVRLCQIHDEVAHLKKSGQADTLERCCKLYEQLGDRCCKLKVYHQAVHFYKKQLKLCRSLNAEKSKVISALVSVASTYSDIRQHDKAVAYYHQEVELRDDCEHKEIGNTFQLIAASQLAGEFPKDSVLKSLSQADRHAREANDVKLKVSVMKARIDALEKFKRSQEAAALRDQLQDMDLPSSSDSETQEDSGAEESSDVPEMESSESEEEAGRLLPKRQQQRVTVKLNKKNHRGETKLQEAAISGNLKLVQTLIQQGADVNTRDHCGWTPLHEACNWGHTAVAQLLLENKANVNDVANAREVTTPLHDAIRNQHLDIVLLLLRFKSNVAINSWKGETPLDLFIDAATVSEGDDRSEWDDEWKQVHQALLTAGAKHRSGYHPPRDTDEGGEYDNSPPSHITRRRRTQRSNTLSSKEPSYARAGTAKRARNPQSRNSSGYKRPPASRGCDIPIAGKLTPASATTRQAVHSSSSTSSLSDVDTAAFPIDGRHAKPMITSASQPVTVLGSDTESLDSDDTYYCKSHQNTSSMGQSLSGLGRESYPFPSSSPCSVGSPSDHVSPVLNRPSRPRGIDFSSDSDGEQPLPSSTRLFQPPLLRAPQRLSQPATANTRGKSPSALVDENDIVKLPGDDNWLIDDIGNCTASSRQSRGFAPTAVSRPHALRTSSRSHAPRPSRDRPTSTISSVHDEPMDVLGDRDDDLFVGYRSDDDVSVRNVAPLPHVGKKKTSSKNPGPLRLRVKVMQLVYLISCPAVLGNTGEPPTIGWLAEQSATRYLASSGMTSKIELCTSDGALFDSSDPVSHVLSDNEVVHAQVMTSSMEPVQQRYANVCAANDTVPFQPVQDALSIAGAHPSKLYFKNLTLPTLHFKFILQALRGCSSLSHLDLSGNSLGDAGVSILSQSLPFLTSLVDLDLSLNCLTVTSLSELARCISDSTGSHGGHQSAAIPALSSLKHLHLGFNMFCSASAHTLQPLLSRLRLHSLSLPASFVCPLVQPSLQDWFGHRQSLVSLDLSCNSLLLPDLGSLLSSLTSETLQGLNLTASIAPSVPGCVGALIAAYLEKPSCSLTSLSLSTCSLSNDDVSKMAPYITGLRDIDLSSNLISWQAAESLSRFVLSCRLKSLSLSGNSMLGTAACSFLIQTAVSRPPEAVSLRLHLAACGMTSPLSQSLLALSSPGDGDSLDTLMSSAAPLSPQITGLSQLTLCHNKLSASDKAALVASWTRRKQHVHCVTAGELCFLRIPDD